MSLHVSSYSDEGVNNNTSSYFDPNQETIIFSGDEEEEGDAEDVNLDDVLDRTIKVFIYML